MILRYQNDMINACYKVGSHSIRWLTLSQAHTFYNSYCVGLQDEINAVFINFNNHLRYSTIDQMIKVSSEIVKVLLRIQPSMLLITNQTDSSVDRSKTQFHINHLQHHHMQVFCLLMGKWDIMDTLKQNDATRK